MMQNDLISRSAAKDEILSWTVCLNKPNLLSKDDTMYILDTIPAVDAMVIPCKIGDTVWAVRRLSGGHLCAIKGVISDMQFIGSEMALSITIRGKCRGEWGKTIFATQEEAEAEIARKRGNHG